jgi:hypothetical protein
VSDPLGLSARARADQQAAANAHARRIFDSFMVGLPGGGTRREIEPRTRPAWLTVLFERHNTASERDGRACDHVIEGGPRPRAIFAWAPGVTVCVDCAAAGMFSPEPGSVAEYTCDGCGEIHREGLRATVIEVAPDTSFYLGVCLRCLATLSG